MSLSVNARGSGSTNTGGETLLAVSPSSNCTRPGLVLLFVAYDNSATGGADPYASISDSVGNTWTVEQYGLADPGAANAGIACRLFSCKQDVGQITTGTTITISFGSNTTVARAYAMWDVVASNGTTPVKGPGSPTVFSNGFGQTSCAYTVQTGSGAGKARTGMVVFGMVCIERNESITGDSDSTSGTWSSAQTAGVGSGATAIGLSGQYKILTGETEFQYNASWTTGSDQCYTYFVVEEPYACTGIDTGAPTLGTPTVSIEGGNHELTATGFATGDPTVGSPALTQDHALTATGIATGAPTLGTPALTQNHALQVQTCTTGTVDIFENASLVTVVDPTGFVPGATVIFKNALDIDEDLIVTIASVDGNEITLNGSAGVSVTDEICVYHHITTDEPTLGEPTLSQDHELDPDGISTDEPTLDEPTLDESQEFAADGIVTGDPTLGSPTLAQVHELVADGVGTGEPTIGTPALTQAHDLSADGIDAGQPTLGEPTLEQGFSVDGISTGNPTLGTPTLTQDHDLTCDGISTGEPTLGEPELTEDGAFTCTGIATGSPTLGSPALTQDHVLTATGFATGAPTLGEPTLDGGSYSLTALGLDAGAPTLGTPTVSLIGLWRILGLSDPILGFRGLAGSAECCCVECPCPPWENDWQIDIDATPGAAACDDLDGTYLHLAESFEAIEETSCAYRSFFDTGKEWPIAPGITLPVYSILEFSLFPGGGPNIYALTYRLYWSPTNSIPGSPSQILFRYEKTTFNPCEPPLEDSGVNSLSSPCSNTSTISYAAV